MLRKNRGLALIVAIICSIILILIAKNTDELNCELNVEYTTSQQHLN